MSRVSQDLFYPKKPHYDATHAPDEKDSLDSPRLQFSKNSSPNTKPDRQNSASKLLLGGSERKRLELKMSQLELLNQ